jgi:hypothetical protein
MSGFEGGGACMIEWLGDQLVGSFVEMFCSLDILFGMHYGAHVFCYRHRCLLTASLVRL